MLIAILVMIRMNAVESPLMMRAYQILGLEDDEQTARNAKQLHAVLSKNPRYSLASYHEPNVQALVMRIHKDLDDALAVIQKNNVVTSLPATSPYDRTNKKSVDDFLDAVGAYTRVIESGQNEKTIAEKAQELRDVLESDDYKNNVALFLSQKPVFDFTMLSSSETIPPTISVPLLSFSQLIDTLHTLQKKTGMLRNELINLKK